MSGFQPNARWTHSLRPGLKDTFFPVGYDQSDLQEVSEVTDRWAKFIHVPTGQLVDCAKFAEAATAESLPDHCLHDSHGFTLIEVMIVLAIVGILLFVALPALQKYCFTNLTC